MKEISIPDTVTKMQFLDDQIEHIYASEEWKRKNYVMANKCLASYAPEPRTSKCYVATAIYGSYNCPEVWTLRRYRDYTLSKTWHGQVFIKLYYLISPKILRLFGNAVWFRHLCKGKLDRFVKKLQDNGYADTPYNELQ